MLKTCHPNSFSDLIKIFGLSHGAGVWDDNAQKLIEEGVCPLQDVAAVSDDIMNYLTKKGMSKETAFDIMENIGKGRAGQILTDEIIKNMLEHDIPEWYIDSLKKIKYMFPKAHAVANIISTVRLGWYKLYYPKEYYKTMNLEVLDVEVFIQDGATKPDYIAINGEKYKTYGDALKKIEQYLSEIRKKTDEC